jgi:tRNA A37 N6-isopentenylltransferase MiaA
LQKKLIGYPEVIAYCNRQLSREAMIALIQQKTRNYAKRQVTFWRMLRTKLQQQVTRDDKQSAIEELNLTHAPIDRYIKQLRFLITNQREKVNE